MQKLHRTIHEYHVRHLHGHSFNQIDELHHALVTIIHGQLIIHYNP